MPVPRSLAIAAVVVGLFLLHVPLAAQTTVTRPVTKGFTGERMLFRADQMRHDKDLGIVVASGNVEISQADRILMADVVTYNQRTEIVTANGNVALLEPSGDVVFADYMELTGDFKNGIVENIRVLLSDDARIAAVSGRRSGGNRTEMRKAVYSPCRDCPYPGAPPMWRIKAFKVIHDRKERQIEYFDAYLEMFGIPVAYTPYFSHPDPTVKRRSGFLTPSFGSDGELGSITRIPYYISIAPDKDATITPIITSNENIVLAGEYRQRFANGYLETTGSFTEGSLLGNTNALRGHFFGKARFDIDDTWRAGADVRFSSDDTYLRRYNFPSSSSLRNNLFVEGFRGRSYAAANAYFFQGLRSTDVLEESPLILPVLDYNFVGEPGSWGERWAFDANLRVITRDIGEDSRRFSLKTGWVLPYISPLGAVYNFYATLEGDAYSVEDVVRANRSANDKFTGFTGRLVPKVGLDWRFPLARTSKDTTQIIEPLVGVVLAPNPRNTSKIPNEDSKNFEFDDTNLSSPRRFPGLDRIDGGARLHYGLKWGVYGGGGGYTTAFIGQSYRPRRDATFEPRSGLEDNFSDVVGRVEIRPTSSWNLTYRFRLRKDDLSVERNEVFAGIGPPALHLSTSYIFVDEGAGSGEFPAREEISPSLSSRLTKFWSVNANATIDLSQGSEMRTFGLGLTYTCEDCFIFTLRFTRNLLVDRDVRPSDTFTVRLQFATLGDFTTAQQR